MRRPSPIAERQNVTGILSAVTLGVVIAILPVAAQSDAPPRPSTIEGVITAVFHPETVTYEAPRTPWGHPDLQGIWGSIQEAWTPSERPKGMVETPDGKVIDDPAVLSDIVRTRHALVATPEYQKSQLEVIGKVVPDFDPGFVELLASRLESAGAVRNSLPWQVVDPKDGRLPPMSSEAQRRSQDAAKRAREKAALYNGRPGGPEDATLPERCIFTGWPMTPGVTNANYQILQTPSHVVVISEMGHNARVISLGGDTPPRSSIRQYSGVQRGHWEGETLVVRSTNFTETTRYRGSTADLILTERFRRIGADKIDYRFTVEDLKVWPRPFTVAVPLTKDDNEQYLYEYMCHEGNEESLSTMLRNARAIEAEMTKKTAAVKR